MKYPRIHLAIDNCFASKRWTAPAEWMRLAASWGIRNIEASADNECDPLYSTPGFLADWKREIEVAHEQFGVRVANLYSGHGTYATLGLGHTDARVRDHMLKHWLFRIVEQARALGAGLGFFCHAFPLGTLEDPVRYKIAKNDLYDSLAAVACQAKSLGGVTAGVEQMYSPHQIPWTIHGARELLREVYKRSECPFYLTLDTGHQCGQRRFLKPGREELARSLDCADSPADTPWLGTRELYKKFNLAAGLEKSARERAVSGICDTMSRYDYLFSEPRDSDTFAWLRELGCYSPIIHLQQTDGTASAHLPFTAKNNRTGIITPRRVLRAIAESYDRINTAGMPPRVSDIYLTIEIFSGTADRWHDLLDNLAESARYWRDAVPADGMTLDKLVDVKETPHARIAA